MRFEGKVALVTGGGTGIGAATARRLASEGARVVVTGRRRQPLDEVAVSIGGLAIDGDVAEPGWAEAAVRATVERFGGLDVVVANAGTGFGGTAGDVDDERWQRTLDVNVTGVLRVVRASIPALLDRAAGSIVLVSSTSGLVSATDSAAYVTSKHALLGLVRSIAVDYGPRGIRANAICPGWVVTPMGDEEMDGLAERRGITREDAYALMNAAIPLRRAATADEIAACIAFLGSDDASIVTGAVLVADGGAGAADIATLPLDHEGPIG